MKKKYKILTIGIIGDTPVCLGSLCYETHPRIGEWVELDENGKGVMYEVVMVAHAAVEVAGAGSEIFVRRLPETSSQARASLWRISKSPSPPNPHFQMGAEIFRCPHSSRLLRFLLRYLVGVYVGQKISDFIQYCFGPMEAELYSVLQVVFDWFSTFVQFLF